MIIFLQIKDAAESFVLINNNLLDAKIKLQYYFNVSVLVVQCVEVENLAQGHRMFQSKKLLIVLFAYWNKQTIIPYQGLFVRVVIIETKDYSIVNCEDGEIFSFNLINYLPLCDYFVKLRLLPKFFSQSIFVIQLVERTNFGKILHKIKNAHI